MALLDLSLVTTALVEFLKAAISSSPAWPFSARGAPLVSNGPPDLLAPGTLGVYLYHVTEEPHLKNQPPQGQGSPPVRFNPMGLSLYYQITALGLSKDEPGTQQEQIYLGCVLKAFHDFPIIDDSTVVLKRTAPAPAALTPVSVLQAAGLDGAGNRLRITMQPVPYEQASTFWNAASLVPRLAAYYQVSVVLLAAEKPARLAGRVLRFGVQSFVGGAPRLDGSESRMSVTVPGFATQELIASPAEVPFGSQLELTGYNLAGDSTRLSIQHVRWLDRVEVDANWGVNAIDDRLFCQVQTEADGRFVLPGLYSARAHVVRRRKLPDGSVHEFAVNSNDTPFSVCARLDPPVVAAGSGTLTGYGFAQPDGTQPAFPNDAVALFIGDIALKHVPAPALPASLQPGEFQAVDAGKIVFRVPAGLAAGSAVSLRVFVFGAESPPQWIAA